MSNSIELARVLDSLPSAVLVVDRDRIVRLANRRARALAGKAAADLSGLHICTAMGCAGPADEIQGETLAPARPSCPLEDTIRKALEHKDKATGTEVTVCLSGEDEWVFRVSTELQCSPEGDLVILALDDVTEGKRLGSERRDAHELREALASARSICHELNQPLQAVAAYVQLAMSALAENQPVLEELKEIRGEVARMGQITQRLQGIVRSRNHSRQWWRRRLMDPEAGEGALTSGVAE
jgi:nitrogen-specific signal transduction histidine kinase